MLGANSLVQHLRILEKNDEELTDSGWYHLLGEVIEQALAIVKDAESAKEKVILSRMLFLFSFVTFATK